MIHSQTKVLIVIGTGGVGKTTLAAAIALGQAAEGKKVLVVTIDPSERLAQALNFKANGLVQKIKLKSSKGELFATTLNHENIFNTFLKKGLQTDSIQDFEKLSENKLFLKLKTKLSHSQDFTTLYSLYEFVQKNEYDFIVLDTPPAQHTWSFLKAPEKLSALFSEEISSVFRKMSVENENGKISYIKKIILSGTQQVIQLLEKLTGSDFIKELKMFFYLIQKWQNQLQSVIFECQKILVASTTEFMIVSQFDNHAFNAAEAISRKIYNEGYRLNYFVINKVPDWLDEKSELKVEEVEKFRKLYLSTFKNIKIQAKTMHKHLKVYKSLNFSQNIKNEDLYEIYKNIEIL